MKKIFLTTLAVIALSGCAKEKKLGIPEPEPVQGTLVHQTRVETQFYAPEQGVVRTPQTGQYMVIGAWRWELSEPVLKTPCGESTCPAELPPSTRELLQQQETETENTRESN